MNEVTKKQNKIINVELTGGNPSTLNYRDAFLSIDSSIGCYVIESIVELPTSEDKDAEKKRFHLVERIPFLSVLRIYTLDEVDD